MLGELISAHDLGSDLAKQITDEADASTDAAYRRINERVSESWQRASEEAVRAYDDLSRQIKVTNSGTQLGRLVDPAEVADALRSYRNQMQLILHAELEQGRSKRSRSAATRAKQEFRRRLTEAAQKSRPIPKGPIF